MPRTRAVEKRAERRREERGGPVAMKRVAGGAAARARRITGLAACLNMVVLSWGGQLQLVQSRRREGPRLGAGSVRLGPP